MGIMWPSVVKSQFTEIKLSCGNMCGRQPPVIPNHIIRPVSRRAYAKWVWFLLVLSYLWYGKPYSRSDGRLQFTVLKLSCGNDPVVKISIYSNAHDGDLALWPNDPKINRVLPLLRGNHVAKFGKDPIYRTKVIVRKPVENRYGSCWSSHISDMANSTADLMESFNLQYSTRYTCVSNKRRGDFLISLRIEFRRNVLLSISSS